MSAPLADTGFDVVIVGGGPAGSVCAARLAQRGRRVLVLEKVRFPRFHLGESLLPHSMPVLAEIGALEQVEKRFIRKYGARFHDDATGRKDRFEFAGAWRGELEHAYQVPRDAFDALLLEHARTSGADVREEWTVSAIVREGTRAVGVDAVGPDGSKVRIAARFVVDASGRDALSAHTARSTEKIGGLDQTALFAHFENVPRRAGVEEGDIDIILFRPDADARPNWFWVIPFKDGRTSVGAVVSRAWLREQRSSGAEDTPALFARAVATSATATEMLAGAKMLWPKAEATADFSYRVRDVVGDGSLVVGDAGGFIDPLFSTGAHMAMTGGLRAADAVHDVLDAPAQEAERLGAWAQEIRAGGETFILAVQAFYAGPLVDHLFAEVKHAALRRSITSLLAGDVFHDSVWLRDARRRLAEMAAGVRVPIA